MTRRIAVLGVVALLLLSGCSGVFGGDGTTTTPGTTATTTDGNGDMPPGIEDGKLANATALVRAHTEAIEDGGYASNTRVRIENTNATAGDVTIINYEARVADGGAPYSLTVNASSDDQLARNRVIWSNETLQLIRTRTRSGNDFSTGYNRKDGGPASIDPAVDGVLTVLKAGEFEVTDVSGSGADRRITLRAVGHDESALGNSGTNITGYDGEILVDGDGRIVRVDVRFRYTNPYGAELVSRVDYEVSERDGVEVGTPAWAGTALAETSDITLSAEFVGDSYVTITNTGSEPIPESHTMAVATNEGVIAAQINRTIDPGQTVYFYREPGGDLAIHYSEPDGETGSLAEAYRFVLLDGENNQVSQVLVER